jgi:hypothetical protein
MIKKIKSDIEVCLNDRKRILNEKFVWSDDAKKGLLKLNSALIEAQKLVVEEYNIRKSELEARRTSDDKFLTDYNIDSRIKLMITTLDESEVEFFTSTILPIPLDELNKAISRVSEPGGIGKILNQCLAEDVCSSLMVGNNDLNWNNKIGAASEHFTDDFIHYGIHYLDNHTPLAWEDILKIRSVWAEVNVDYQRESDLF